jgi:hypothetical protein
MNSTDGNSKGILSREDLAFHSQAWAVLILQIPKSASEETIASERLSCFLFDFRAAVYDSFIREMV